MLNSLLAIVAESGNIIREAWKKPRKVSHKGHIDLVTETDIVVEKFLKEHLRVLLPSANFMAEESATSFQVPGGDCWIIDPLDGTTNFVHRIPFVGTSVALWRQGRVELGVVNMPLLDECFHAQRGMGAWSGSEPLAVSGAKSLEEAVVGTGFPYDVPPLLPAIVGCISDVLPRVQGMRRLGAAAVDMAYVAAGRLDAFYEMDLKPWDVAAGWLLVEEAGGYVSCPDGSPFAFGRTVLASNGHVHHALGVLLKAARA